MKESDRRLAVAVLGACLFIMAAGATVTAAGYPGWGGVLVGIVLIVAVILILIAAVSEDVETP